MASSREFDKADRRVDAEAVRALCVSLVLWGCSEPTTILINARMAAGETAPAELAVSLFDAHGARVVDHALGAARLPGTLIITGLRDDSEEIRVVLTGKMPHSLGSARVPTERHQQVRAAIELSIRNLDSDGDGVPDTVDDCPDDADARQENSDGTGTGDACSNFADLSVPPVDLGAVDLAGVDLSGADLQRNLGDGSIDAGGSTKCPGSFLLCDSFEGGFNNGLWSRRFDRRDDGGTPTIGTDTTRAYRGTRSMHVHVDPIGGPGVYVQAKARQDSVAPSPSVFIRAFFYLSPGIMSENSALMSLEQETDPFGGVALEVEQNGQLVLATYTTDPAPSYFSSTHLPFGKWVCLEWEAQRGPTSDMGTGTNRIWVDDVEVGDLTKTDLTYQPFFGSTSFGFEFDSSGALPALDLWIDEIVIDAQRIGCLN